MSDRASQRRTIVSLATRPVSFQVLGEALGMAPDADALLDLVIEVLALGMVRGRIDGVRGYLDVVSCTAEQHDVDALATACPSRTTLWQCRAHRCHTRAPILPARGTPPPPRPIYGARRRLGSAWSRPSVLRCMHRPGLGE